MKLQKLALVLFLTGTTGAFAQDNQTEDSEKTELQQQLEENPIHYSNQVQPDFDSIEDEDLTAITHEQEPSRFKAWIAAFGLACVIKYIEMKDAVSDMSDSVADWWNSFLVFCHLKNEQLKEIDAKEYQA